MDFGYAFEGLYKMAAFGVSALILAFLLAIVSIFVTVPFWVGLIVMFLGGFIGMKLAVWYAEG